jgi:hypothetical protein
MRRGARLHTQPQDVLVMYRTPGEAEDEAQVRRLQQLAADTGCTVIVLDEGERIDHLDEAAMAAQGWARADRMAVVMADPEPAGV